MADHPSRTARLVADDKAYVWHPFTQMADYLRDEPLIVERGEGSYLIDTEGRRYLDGVSSLWVTVHGHRNRRNAAGHGHDQLPSPHRRWRCGQRQVRDAHDAGGPAMTDRRKDDPLGLERS